MKRARLLFTLRLTGPGLPARLRAGTEVLMLDRDRWKLGSARIRLNDGTEFHLNRDLLEEIKT